MATIAAPEQGSQAPPARFSTATVAVAATLGMGLILLIQVFLAPAAPFGGLDKPGAWDPPRDRAELLVAKMDGHTFAQTATDPTMARTVDDYNGDEANAAYRSARPVMGWAYFVSSAGGQRVLLAPSILVLTALAAGALVLSVDALIRALGGRSRFLVVILATPALVASAAYPGISEPWACVLTLLGLTAWTRGRAWPAVILFTFAALTRETMLLVPLGIGLDHLVRTRRPSGVLKLAVPALAYVGWTGIVYLRIGALPSDYSQTGGLLEGFTTAAPHWKGPEYATALLFIASGVAIVAFGTGWMKATLAAHAAFYLFMNHQVWWVWWGFGRVGPMIPLLGLVALVVHLTADDPAPPADEQPLRASSPVLAGSGAGPD